MFGVLAAVLAAAGSWIPSLWGDEAATVMSSTRSVPSLLTMLRHVDAVHGTYYLLMHGWIDVFGPSPFSVRLPSALAVGLAVAGAVTLAKTLSGTRVAVLAGIVTCLVPRVTYMGEEARAYALDAAVAAWLLVLLVHLIRRPDAGRRRWVAYGALLTLGVYLFLYMGLFVAAHAAVLAVSRVPAARWRRWAVTTLVALVAISPLLLFAYRERSQIAFLSTTNTTDFVSLTVGLWFGKWTVAVAAWALIVVGLAPSVVRAVRGAVAAGRGAGVRPTVDAARTAPSLELVAAAWLFVPVLLLLAANLVTPVFSGRYLSMSAPAAGLAIAIGLDRLLRARVVLGVVATVVVVALCVPVYLSQRTPYAKNASDWAEISATLGAHASPGQAVVFDESAKVSRRPRLAMHTYPAGFAGLRDVTLKTPFTSSTTWYDRTLTVEQAVEAGRFHGVSTVWLIEYSDGTTTDSYGRADLQAAGFGAVASYRTHSALLIEYVRGAQ